MDEPASFHWRRGLLCGLLWAVTVMLIDLVSQPFEGLNWPETASFVAQAGFASLAAGLVWSVGAEWTASHRRKLVMFALQLPIAVVASVAAANAPIQSIQYSSSVGPLMSNVPLSDFTCHMVWTNGLFGGFYILGYHATQRSIRLRRRLSDLRLTCGEADTRLRETRLQAYRGQIRPATLLEALRELQHRYSFDRSAGDQLFDRLVDFLRAAMPGLRDGGSTLSAELAIMSSYAMLRNAVENDHCRWQLRISPPQHDNGSDFVPLRMLTSLDKIDRCVPQGHSIEITMECQSGTIGVNVKAGGVSLTNEERQRLKTDLESALGADAIVMTDVRGHLSMGLRLPGEK